MSQSLFIKIGVLAVLLLLLSPFSMSAESLRVGINPEYPPLAYTEQGQLTGIEPALALEVGKILGRKIEFVQLSFEKLIPALEQGNIDVIMSGLSVTSEREQLISFSDSYLQIGQMAIIRSADMIPFGLPRAIHRTGAKVGVEPDTTGASYATDYLGDASVSVYDNPTDAFAALAAGTIDFYIHDAPTSWNLAQVKNSPFISLYQYLTHEDLAWAVRKGNQRLLGQLNGALAQLTANGRMDLIQDYYIPVKVRVGN